MSIVSFPTASILKDMAIDMMSKTRRSVFIEIQCMSFSHGIAKAAELSYRVSVVPGYGKSGATAWEFPTWNDVEEFYRALMRGESYDS